MELKYPKPEAKLVIVPSEPTQAMLNAYDEARAATTMHPPGSVETYNPHQSYWALLNAAPKIINPDMNIFPRAEVSRLEKIGSAAEGAKSWLDNWAQHVGTCPDGQVCTCGLDAVRYELAVALQPFT